MVAFDDQGLDDRTTIEFQVAPDGAVVPTSLQINSLFLDPKCAGLVLARLRLPTFPANVGKNVSVRWKLRFSNSALP